MPVDTLHPEYEAAAMRWKRCRDAVAGQDAVHAAGETYLPKLTEQGAKEYEAYRRRAMWFGATGRTWQGMMGMVFRTAPVVEAPASMQGALDDLTLSGLSANDVARDVMGQVLEVGRVGVLVEYPQQPTGPMTLAQAQAMGRRAFASLYRAESIRQWRVQRVGNRMQLTLLVLGETAEEPDGDEFTLKQIPQLRALMLTQGDGGPMYVQRLYRKAQQGATTSDAWVPFGADIVPRMAGRPLQEIPFTFFGPDDLSARVQIGPLSDLVDVNFGHYLNTADLEHGAHFTGLPTPWITGYRAEEGEKAFALGSATLLAVPNKEAQLGFLEFTGQGLAALETRCKAKEAMMAALGARMLAPEKAGVEAADTLALRGNGEASVLAGMANVVSRGMERVLSLVAQWEGIAGTVSYRLNTDYMPAGMTPEQLAQLMAAWQAGGISWNTLFDNLKRGEIIAEGVTDEEEQARIEATRPTLTTPTNPAQQAA
jgi:hypothetical protein